MQKKILKYFFLFLFLFLLIFNWSKISFLFSPQFLILATKSFFEKKAHQKISQVVVEKPKISCKKTQKEDSIEIEKISVFAPLIIIQDEKEIEKALEKGVVHFPGSALPGQKGLIIILGHSAPPNWPKIRYEWVFSKIGELEVGDEIKVNFQGCEYSFSVKEKKIFKKGEELPKEWQNVDGLCLISCWPPGKNLKRIGVLAQRIL